MMLGCYSYRLTVGCLALHGSLCLLLRHKVNFERGKIQVTPTSTSSPHHLIFLVIIVTHPILVPAALKLLDTRLIEVNVKDVLGEDFVKQYTELCRRNPPS